MLGIATLTSVVLTIGLSYHTWDAIATWALGGYGMVFRESILGAAEFGNGVIQYPMNIQLQIALFRLIDGDILPGSKLLFPMYYLSLLIGVYQFLLYWKVSKPLARISTLLVATTPVVFYHSYIGYTNLAFTTYFILGVFWLVRSIYNGKRREALLAGTLLAAGLWTRPEGVVLTALTLTITGLTLLIQRKTLRTFLFSLLPVLVVYGGWKLLLPEIQDSWNVTPPVDFTRTAVEGVLRGEIYWDAFIIIFRYIVGQIIRFRDFGVLAGLAIVSLLVGLRWKRLKSKAWLQCLWLITAFCGIAILGAHYIGAYQPGGNDFLYSWLSLEFTRVALPVLVMVFTLSQISLSEVLTDWLDQDSDRELQTAIVDTEPIEKPPA